MKIFVKSLLSICFIFITCFSVQALDEAQVTGKIFTIDECIDYALNNDPEVKIAKQQVNVYKSRIGQAKSDYFPRLGAGTRYNFAHNKVDDNSASQNTFGVDATVNQLIWNFGKTGAKINMQKYNEQSSEFDLEFEILVTVYKVKMAYYEVLAAKAGHSVSRKTVRINKLNYERTKALFEEGLKSKIDVVNAEVNYTDSKIQLVAAEHAYEVAKINLANSMYYTEGTDFEVENTENFNLKIPDYTPAQVDLKKVPQLKDGSSSEMILTSGIEKIDVLKDFDFKPYTTSVEDAVERAYQNRPDLKSLQLVLKASDESLKAIKRSWYPDLGASAGYGFTNNTDATSNSFKVSAGLEFTGVNAMDVKYKIDEGKAYYDIAGNNVDFTKKNIYFEVNNSYVNMKQLERRIPLMAHKVEQTLENFQLADGRYTVGLGNYIELQDAQVNYNNAQLEFIQCVFKYNVAREEFLKSMGVR